MRVCGRADGRERCTHVALHRTSASFLTSFRGDIGRRLSLSLAKLHEKLNPNHFLFLTDSNLFFLKSKVTDLNDVAFVLNDEDSVWMDVRTPTIFFPLAELMRYLSPSITS